MKPLDELLSIYSKQIDILSVSYDMMGKLLDKKRIKKNIEHLNLSDVYIYGGGYLGIQLYHAINEWVNIISVVDRNGVLMFDIPDIPVIDLDKFKRTYHDQPVIITPIKHYHEISQSLDSIVTAEKKIYLGEIIGE